MVREHRRVPKFDAQLNSESFRQDEFKDEPAQDVNKYVSTVYARKIHLDQVF
ncbi:MAG: palindromic element RPE3 domain-containing protein [Rickettsia endosymbiont of Argas persicus]